MKAGRALITRSQAGYPGAPDLNRWAALAVLPTGVFLAPLEFFIGNVALPSITGGCGRGPASVCLSDR